MTSNSCDRTALNYQLHPVQVTCDNTVSRFWHLGDETAEQIISKFPFKVCRSTFLLMILNVGPQSSKPWSACVCDWFNGTGSIIVFLIGKTSHSSAECALSFSSQVVQKIPQGQQELSTIFPVNTSISPNLPHWHLVWAWTNGKTCNLIFAITELKQHVLSLVQTTIGFGESATHAVQEVVHYKQNLATRGCVIASYCVDNSGCPCRNDL